MAHRDYSQGFGFMYLDISKILKEKERIFDTQQENQINFNKDSDLVPTAVQHRSAVHEVKQNLDKMKSLQHQLQYLLEEIEKNKKK